MSAKDLKRSALDGYARLTNNNQGSFMMQQFNTKFREYALASTTNSHVFMRSGASIVAENVSGCPARNAYTTAEPHDPSESCPTVASGDGDHGNFAQYMRVIPRDGEDTAGLGRVGRELATKGIGHVEMRPGLMKTGSDEAATNCRAHVERLLAQRKN